MTRGPGKRDEQSDDAGDGEPDQGQLQAKDEPTDELVAVAPDDVPIQTKHAHIRWRASLKRGGALCNRTDTKSALPVLDWEPSRRRLELNTKVLGECGLVVREVEPS